MDNSELKKLAAYHIDLHGGTWYSEESLQLESIPTFSAEAFIVVASPAAVLGLIAENERLQREEKSYAIACKAAIERQEELRIERDQLKAENAQLKKQEIELKAENSNLRNDYAALATFNPDWDRVAAAQDSVREHMDLANQLKAECEGLRVDAERYRFICDKFGETKLPCALERILAGNLYVADGKPSIDSAIDAAMGKGELS